MLRVLLILIIFFIPSFGGDSSFVHKYDREAFTGRSSWIDEDNDCQNTRAEVLIEEHMGGLIKFRGGKRCVVHSGRWYDLYSGKLYRLANDMDIEHVVSLKDAWESGAKNWSHEYKKKFANYLEDPDHLLAVSKSENRSKGSKGPDKYLPPNIDFVKEYCRKYIRIKVRWNLTVTKDQLIVLQGVMDDEPITYPKVR